MMVSCKARLWVSSRLDKKTLCTFMSRLARVLFGSWFCFGEGLE